MKKGFIAFGSFLFAVLMVLIFIPLLFKGKIKEVIVDTANTHLNAKLGIENLSLNLLTNFPKATVSMENVFLSGVDELKKDTLFRAKSAKASISLLKLISGEYDISQVELNNIVVRATEFSDGRKNWDIVKKDTLVREKTPLNLKLRQIALNNCYIFYDNRKSDIHIKISDWNGRLLGNFTADKTIIESVSTIEEVYFAKKGITYLRKLKVATDAAFDADLKNRKFTFTKSRLHLNHVELGIDGSITILDTDKTDYDLKFHGAEIHFKDILSLMPVIYTGKNFKNIVSSGDVSFQGYIKGLKQGKEYPVFKFHLAVDNGMFQYPSMPRSVRDVNVDMMLSGNGGSLDSTVIDIGKFNLSAGDHSFRSNLEIRTPVTNPQVNAHMDGTFDLEIIKEIFPVDEKVKLSGQLISDLNIVTQPSDRLLKQDDDIMASGYLNLNNVVIKWKDTPAFLIESAKAELDAKSVDLSLFNMKTGKSDLSLSGKLTNLLGYAIKGQPIKGELNAKSDYFNPDDFSTKKGASSSPFIVPSNIEGVLHAKINKGIYDQLSMTNVSGSANVKNGVITVNSFFANTLGGSCKANGTYNTANGIKNPRLNFSLNMNKISFAQTVKSLELAQLYTPVFKSVSGNYSLNFNFTTTLENNTDKTLSKLNGSGWLRTDEVKVNGVESLNRLSSLLKINVFNSFTTKNVYIMFSVKDSKITTQPFDVNINHFKLNMGGTTGFDQSIDYKGTVFIPKYTIVGLVSDVGFKIKGDFNNPQITLLPKPAVKSTLNSTVGKIPGSNVVSKEIGKVGNNISKKVLRKK